MTNIYAVALAVIPALLNIGILIYLLFFLPRGKTTNLFALFIIALILWQAQDTVARTVITEDAMRFWHRMLCVGWFSVAPLILHFIIRYTSRRKYTDTRILAAIYAPFLLLYTYYLSIGDRMNFVRHEFWGWLSQERAGSLDLFQRYVIAVVVIIALIILFKHVLKQKNPTNKYQGMVIAIGILIPTVQGCITQVILTTLYGIDLPLTSTFFTALSITTIIALNRYKLFDVSESLDVEGVLENLHNFVIILSPKGKIIYFNSFAAKKLNLHTDMENDLADLFGDNKKEIKTFRNQVLKNALKGNIVTNYETEFCNTDGKVISVLLSSEVVRNNNLIQGILLIATDISSKKEEENHLRLLESVIINSTDMVVITDAGSMNDVPRIIFTNKAFSTTSGFSFDEVQGHPLYRIQGESVTGDEWKQKFILPCKGEVIKSELKNHNKSKREYWVESTCFTVENNQGEISNYVIIQRDITESRKQIRAIQRQNRKMKEIAWTQSHVVRAPLARILGLTEIIKHPEHQGKDHDQILSYIEESANELDTVIRNIVEKTNNIDEDIDQ